MNVLFTYQYSEPQMASISALGFSIDYIAEKNIAAYPKLDEVDILVCYNPFRDIQLEQLPRLTHLILSSAGVDQVPKEEALRKGIVVTNNRGGYSKPMGEWVVWTLLNIYKNSKHFIQCQKLGHWQLDTNIRELVHKNIGIIGTGSIGSACAERLKGFEVNLIGFNTQGTPVALFKEVYSISRLESILPKLDVLIVTVPYTPETHLLINESVLSCMKQDSVLINVSRGLLVDESALLAALNQGKFLGVGLDVFQEEPLPEGHSFWAQERVYVTPHNSWVSEMRNSRRFDVIFENLRRLKEGEPLVNVINISRGY